MPILYESYARVRRKTVRPKRVSSLITPSEPIEAPRWRVVEEYGVSSIYLTPEQLEQHLRTELAKACEEKDSVLEYFKVIDKWAIFKGFYTEYHIKYEAYIKGSPISQLVVLAILLICLTVLIIFAIWLVKTYIVEPIWGPIPPELKPILGTVLVIGGSLLAISAGVYIVKSMLARGYKGR